MKTKRLDVAEVCLGHMKDCRGLAILRSIDIDKNKKMEEKIAFLALHLGMYVSMLLI